MSDPGKGGSLTVNHGQLDGHAAEGHDVGRAEGGVDLARGGHLAEARDAADERGVVPVQGAVDDGEGDGDGAGPDGERDEGHARVGRDDLVAGAEQAVGQREHGRVGARRRVDGSGAAHEAGVGGGTALALELGTANVGRAEQNRGGVVDILPRSRCRSWAEDEDREEDVAVDGGLAGDRRGGAACGGGARA